MNEEWRDIPGYPGYQASSLGRVRSIDRWIEHAAVGRFPAYRRYCRSKVLRVGECASGHVTVHPRSAALGRRVTQYVHVLVALAFHGPRPFEMEVLHLDHVPSNNRSGNLKWGTRAENIAMDYARGARDGNRSVNANIL